MSDEDWNDDGEEWEDDGDGGDWGGDGDGGDGWGSDEAAGDDGGEVPVNIQIENLFYEAEDNRRSDPKAALEQFEKCYELEKNEGGEIFKRFKALERIVTLQFQFKNYDAMTERYKELLSYATKVTRNDSSESINNVLNSVGESKNFDLLNTIYEVTLEALQSLPSMQRMWFDISMKLCKTQMERQKYDDVKRLLRELHQSCKLADGSDDPAKGSQLLAIYAVEIQVASLLGDSVGVKELYAKTKALESEINEPRSMSIIRECWGKMWASIGKWTDAYGEFWSAFLQYQEIGHQNAKQCLKYVVVANMLSQNDANPFDAREAKVYEHDPEIEAIVNLRYAYDDDDIRRFEQILKQNSRTITADPFINSHVNDLLMRIRSRACVNLVKPYTRVKIDFLARRLNITREEAESLVVNLILDEDVVGKVDQINGVLDLSSWSGKSEKYDAMDVWSQNLANLSEVVTARGGVGSPDRGRIEQHAGSMFSMDFGGLGHAFRGAASVFGM